MHFFHEYVFYIPMRTLPFKSHFAQLYPAMLILQTGIEESYTHPSQYYLRT